METRLGFAKALKNLRKKKGLTQEDLSEYSSRTYISSLERAIKSPTLDKIDEISEMMDIHPLELLILTYKYASPRKSINKAITKILSNIESS